MSCSAPPGTSAAEWVALASHLQQSGSWSRAAVCLEDAALADPLAHEPVLQRGLLSLAEAARGEAALRLSPTRQLDSTAKALARAAREPPATKC